MYINLITIDLCPGQGGGGVKPSGTLEISENGVYNVYTYASASVDVHPSASLSETYISNGNYNITGEFNGGVITVDVPAPQFITETLSVSANGTYTPSEGIDGYSQVNVNVPVPQFVTEPLNVSANGTYTPSEGIDGYSQVNVNVPATQFITETLNVSENGTYNPGQGIDGYSQVVVDVPQSVTGFTEKDLTEKTIDIINLNNSASFVASSAFNGNQNIKTVNLPYATTVNNYAFHNCSSLSQVSLPVCSYIGNGVFNNCSSLSQVSLPMCNNITSSAFNNCSSLSQVNLPMCNHIGSYAFRLCSLLSQVSLPMCSYIAFRAFDGCLSLSIITIGYSSVCNLEDKNGFLNTPIASGTGSIYVPASLVDAYKSASNWSYFSTQIFPIE